MALPVVKMLVNQISVKVAPLKGVVSQQVVQESEIVCNSQNDILPQGRHHFVNGFLTILS
jgi:hypothetical protein